MDLLYDLSAPRNCFSTKQNCTKKALKVADVTQSLSKDITKNPPTTPLSNVTLSLELVRKVSKRTCSHAGFKQLHFTDLHQPRRFNHRNSQLTHLKTKKPLQLALNSDLICRDIFPAIGDKKTTLHSVEYTKSRPLRLAVASFLVQQPTCVNLDSHRKKNTRNIRCLLI